jgi:hypothetical protein
LFAIQSPTVLGFLGASGGKGESELSHDFDSGFLAGWKVRGLAMAYCGFFGSGFLSPSVSPVLLKKFLVPVPTLSNAEGSFLTTFEIGLLGSVLASDENGDSSDQPSHTAGHIPVNTTSAAQADKILAILTTMMTTFYRLPKEETNVDRRSCQRSTQFGAEVSQNCRELSRADCGTGANSSTVKGGLLFEIGASQDWFLTPWANQ